jgi:hypothetical protein
MNTCNTCAYWSDKAPYSRPDGFAVRMCMSEKLMEDFYSEGEDTLCYSYSEGGAFYTGPKFGCVHHKEQHGLNA